VWSGPHPDGRTAVAVRAGPHVGEDGLVTVDPSPTVRMADLRRAYAEHGLAESDLAPTWLGQFHRWFADAEAAGVAEPNAMVFATASPAAQPSLRTVLCKGVDQRGFTLYTNLGSRKGRDALANPQASLLFPWHPLERQVIVGGTVERVDPAEADAYWVSRPYGSRLGAAASPQGQVIASRRVLEDERERLAREYPDDIPRPEGWGGLRVRPDTVEFWQGRADRLHDRLSFRRDGDDWVVDRLAP
jgi:pyridoxamine 5'-phosphate oxidase